MVSLIPTLAEAPSQSKEQQRVLELARRLNRIGRRSERFLSMQLQQLELAMADFDRERAAWRRQQQRESQQLEELRSQLEQQQREIGTHSVQPSSAAAIDSLRRKARSNSPREVMTTGSAPVRVLLQPGSSSRMQIGLLMFEASKLNRELGGDGIRFEVKDCRSCADNHAPDANSGGRGNAQQTTLLEFEAFSHARLINSPEQLRVWENYKSVLLMSSLSNPMLDTDFKNGTSAPRDNTIRELGNDAAHRAFEANSKCFAEDRPHGPAFRTTGGTDAIRQQLERLESLVDLLGRDHGLLIHVALV